jgi:multidrug efflux system membrane fusion protein
MMPRALPCSWPAVLALAACSGSKPFEKPLTPVSVAKVTSYSTSAAVRYSATVKPDVEVTAAFKVGGYVDEILSIRDDRGQPRDAQPGDRVRKGTALARVRASDYEQRVAQVNAGTAEAAALFEQARLDFERVSRLYERGSVTKPEFEGAKARLEAARAKQDGARAGLAEVRMLLDDVTLRSPIDGVVLKRLIERGGLVAPGQAAFKLADTSTVKVSFGVPDVVVKSLSIGRPQKIAFEALKGVEFEGRITSIAPSPDPVSRVYEVEVSIPNRRDQILVGFIASLELADVGGQTLPTVPLEAIVTPPSRPGEYAVFLLEDQKDHEVARLRPVKLGEALGSLIVVTEGLAVGQRVVVRGATLINDGEAVRPLQ